MKKIALWLFLIASVFTYATEHTINSVDQFNDLSLQAGDVVIWQNGTYSSDERIHFSGAGTASNPIILKAETPGGVVFDNGLQMDISGTYLIVDGFYWNGGYGASNFIQFRKGSAYAENSTIQNCAINGLRVNPDDQESGTSVKHRWIVLYGSNNSVLNCSFMNKDTAGALVLAEYEYNAAGGRCNAVGHTISNNYFYNFEKIDSSLSNAGDSETIRIGTSEFQNVNSAATVSGNYFVQADGENEIITNKSANNTYFNNTFRRCRGSLVMRHGTNATVNNNFFLGENVEGTGAIRIADSDHTITNNYIQNCVTTVSNAAWNNGLTFVGGNTNSVPDCTTTSVSNAYQDVENITFSNNTFVNTNSPIYFNDSRDGSDNVFGTVANNVFYFDNGNQNTTSIINGAYSEIGNTLSFSGNIYDGTDLGESASGFSSANLSASSNGEIYSISGASGAGASISGAPLTDSDVGSSVGACFLSSTGSILSECGSVEEPTDYLTIGSVSGFGAEASSKNLSVSSNISWSVTDNQSWITLSPTSGSNNGSVSISVSENTASSSRSGTVTISGSGVSSKTINITQEGAGITDPIGNANIPSDLMENCNQWKITYPDGEEDKTLCGEANNEYFYVNDNKDAITFRVPIRSNNGSTPNSDYIRSELRERVEDGGSDIYWTTEGTHFLYVEQAITHLPIVKSHLVATQIHGDKAAGIDDSMVMRLEDSHLFLSFNGGKLRDDVTIKTDYNLGDKHEVIFKVEDGKHYCYYSEDGNLLSAYQNGNASQYLVRADGNDYVMDLNYDQSYFKVGNYTQSNAEREGDETDREDNYGEVLVYNFSVSHGDQDDVVVDATGVSFDSNDTTIGVGASLTLSASVNPSNATNQGVSYSSSNTSVATVTSYGEVTGVSEGTATITVTSNDGGFTDAISVTVSEPSTDTNLALNKSVSTEGTVDGANVVGNITDGDTTTRWSASGFPQTAVIDLGSVQSLSATEVVCYNDRAYQFTISVSNTENGTYTEVVDRSSNTTAGTEDSPISDSFSDTDGRFVKITVTGAASYTGSWSSLLEVRVFPGEGGDVEPDSLSVSSVDDFSSDGESQTIDVTSNIDWTVSESSSWISVNTTSGSDDGEVVITTTENTSTSSRSATVTIAGEDLSEVITITQEGAVIDFTSCTSGTNLALNSTIVDYSAQQNTTNSVDNILDENDGNRWSAEGFPQYAVLDLGDNYSVNEINLATFNDRDYQFIVEGSIDSASSGFSTLVNATNNSDSGPINRTFATQTVRYVKLTITGANSYSGSWCSISDFEVICAGTSQPSIVGFENKTIENTNLDLEVYPNPFLNKITITSELDSIDSYLIIDVYGKIVAKGSVTSSVQSVNVNNLNSGLYFMKVLKDNTLVSIKKLMKR